MDYEEDEKAMNKKRREVRAEEGFITSLCKLSGNHCIAALVSQCICRLLLEYICLLK